jgi:transcription elongation factor GreA
MECPAAEYAVQTASQPAAAWRRVLIMADARHIAPAVDNSPQRSNAAETGVLLTQVDFDALVCELETLRSTYRSELARRLREARTFGSSTENDDLLAVAEDAFVDQARIAQLEQLVRLASVVEHAAADDGAGLGSTVRVADEAGRATEYMLIGRRGDQSYRNEVTMASPVGKALWGARSGDVVHVTLPNGRARTLRVLAVRHGSLSGATATLDGAARAA